MGITLLQNKCRKTFQSSAWLTPPRFAVTSPGCHVTPSRTLRFFPTDKESQTEIFRLFINYLLQGVPFTKITLNYPSTNQPRCTCYLKNTRIVDSKYWRKVIFFEILKQIMFNSSCWKCSQNPNSTFLWTIDDQRNNKEKKASLV